MGSRVHLRPNLGVDLAQFKQQIRNQATSRVTEHSTIQDGGLTILDADGNVRMMVGKLPDGTYGEIVLDNSGVVQVKQGELNASPEIYGLAVLPFGGTQLQQVAGFLNIGPANASNVTNTSYTAFGAPNDLVVEIGPSGEAVMSVFCNISTGSANQQGIVEVKIDGGTAFGILELSSSASLGCSGTLGATQTVSGLTAGSHTFELGYVTANNGSASVSFTSPKLIVQPL